MFCPACGGGPHPEEARFCKKCGRALPVSPPPPSSAPSPAVAAVPRRARDKKLLRAGLIALVTLPALFPGLPLSFAVADALRASALRALAERGWPPAKADATVRIVSMKFPAYTLEWSGYDRPDAFNFDKQWLVSLPAEAIGQFDPSCGRDCASALRIDGLRILPADFLSLYQGSTSAHWHFWHPKEGRDRCFLELDDPLPEMKMVIDPLAGKMFAPREMEFADCPGEIRWIPL